MAKEYIFNPEDILEHVRPTPTLPTHLSEEEKINLISVKFEEIMNILGLDLKNDSLSESPKRVAKMYVNELFSGLNLKNFPEISVIENDMKYDQMVVVRDIGIMSTCEHHFVTISGLATVAYIPKDRVIGLSKMNRIAKFFSRRPQVQERLTKQIADCLEYILQTSDVAVHVNAKHYCVVSRGVEDINSTTVTNDLRGEFKNSHDTRAEFFKHCRL